MPHIHTDADPKSIAIASGLVGLGSHGHSLQEGCPERRGNASRPTNGMDSVGPREMTKEGSGVSELTNFEQTLFRASRYDYAFEQ